MIRLSEEEIIYLHARLIQRYGGSDGIRDRRSLDAAINAPFQTFEGQDLYPTVIDKAARFAYGLISNHPFVDGNKRVGTMAMLLLLRLNDISLSYTQQELIKIMLDIAAGRKNDQDLRKWIDKHQMD